jgi:hypothetical protein
MNFHSCHEEPVKESIKMSEDIKIEEEESTEMTQLSPRSLTGRMNANDLLVNILDSESSSFEAFNV